MSLAGVPITNVGLFFSDSAIRCMLKLPTATTALALKLRFFESNSICLDIWNASSLAGTAITHAKS